MTRTEENTARTRLPIRPLLWLLIAFAGLILANAADPGLFDIHDRVLAKALGIGGAAVFAVGGVIATRAAASDVDGRLRTRGLGSAGSMLGMIITAAGYCVVALTVLSLLAVPLQQLLVGGALTGVVIGIAAQQTLGNVFAGLMILVVRPFRVGDTIEVRSGALNGPFTGSVRALGLTYVTLAADNGTLLLPNAGVLAAGVTVGLTSED